MVSVKDINPIHWRFLRRFIDEVRSKYFVREVDVSDKHIIVQASIEELRKVLGKKHFTNSWELSYHYEGEDLNMRRPMYIDDEYEWYQLHVRGFEEDNGSTSISCHIELEPTEYPYEHIQEINYDEESAIEDVASILEEEDIEFDRKV